MAAIDKPTNITSVLQEDRLFPPPKAFSKRAHIKSLAEYRKLYNQSVRAPEKFWGKQAKNELVWFKPWKKVLQWKEPFSKWFVGGQLNVTYNCLDRHLNTPIANNKINNNNLTQKNTHPIHLTIIILKTIQNI